MEIVLRRPPSVSSRHGRGRIPDYAPSKFQFRTIEPAAIANGETFENRREKFLVGICAESTKSKRNVRGVKFRGCVENGRDEYSCTWSVSSLIARHWCRELNQIKRRKKERKNHAGGRIKIVVCRGLRLVRLFFFLSSGEPRRIYLEFFQPNLPLEVKLIALERV